MALDHSRRGMLAESHVAPLIGRGRYPAGQERHDLDHRLDLDPRLDLDHHAPLQERGIERENRLLAAELLCQCQIGIESVRQQSLEHRRHVNVRAEIGEVGKLRAEVAIEDDEASRSW